MRLVLAALLFLSWSAFAERITVQRDSGTVLYCYLWEEQPDSNGNSSVLYVGMVGVSDKISLLHFDVSAIPADATITDARLILEADSTDGVEIEIHPLTAQWLEAEPTWNNFLANISPNIKVRFTPVVGRNVVEVPYLVQTWVNPRPNFGFAMRQATRTAATTFSSSDSTPISLRPMLEVIFERAAPLIETPVPALDAASGVPFRYPLSAHTPRATGYELSGGPASIDPVTGELTWTPSQAECGDHAFNVIVRSGTREETIPIELSVHCPKAMKVGFACGATGPEPGLLVLLALFLGSRRSRQFARDGR